MLRGASGDQSLPKLRMVYPSAAAGMLAMRSCDVKPQDLRQGHGRELYHQPSGRVPMMKGTFMFGTQA